MGPKLCPECGRGSLVGMMLPDGSYFLECRSCGAKVDVLPEGSGKDVV